MQKNKNNNNKHYSVISPLDQSFDAQLKAWFTQNSNDIYFLMDLCLCLVSISETSATSRAGSLVCAAYSIGKIYLEMTSNIDCVIHWIINRPYCQQVLLELLFNEEIIPDTTVNSVFGGLS